MEKIIFYFIFFNLLNVIFSDVPLWNLTASSFDLFANTESSSISLEIYKGSCCGNDNVILKKIITKNENSVIEQNYITMIIDGNTKTMETNWEGIESHYCLGNNQDSYKCYICPKGSNHMNLYTGSDFIVKRPNNFDYNGEWELKSYDHLHNLIFIGYLNNYRYFYPYDYYSEGWQSRLEMQTGLYDFKWTTDTTGDCVYPLLCIVKTDWIKIFVFQYTIRSTNDIQSGSSSTLKKLIYPLDYFHAYFDSDHHFYYLTYNSKEFKSGYCLQNIYYNTDGNSISITQNNDSPLDFLFDFNIISVDFIRNTKYAYYQIYNTEDGKTYYGIIDIGLNKVVFNTNEKINSFKPFVANSINSFLAITDTSAYQI